MLGLEVGVGLIFWGFAIRVVGEVVLDVFGFDTKMEMQARRKKKQRSRENRENGEKRKQRIFWNSSPSTK